MKFVLSYSLAFLIVLISEGEKSSKTFAKLTNILVITLNKGTRIFFIRFLWIFLFHFKFKIE
ncbi:MAG: hypothetical protein CVU03_05755 [Bacteroidetes bacterium HGW-Bacteroidetes-2]|nr:MAG: hypothetical protein CVU03_05755 [Bacteroidetes bacterium HGW-Bacteroidetes-2]